MPEVLFTGGTVLLMDEHFGEADALLVRDNRIAAVGTAQAVAAEAGADAAHYDLDGRALIPGFNDNHIHLANMADRERTPSLAGLSKAEIIERVREAYADAAPGEWLIATQWDYPSCPDPHLGDLDSAFPDNPVALFQFSGHAAWLNSRALATLGISAETPDWDRGGVDVDADGRLTGIIREPFGAPGVRGLFQKCFTDPAAMRQNLPVAFSHLNRHGITSVQDNTWFPHVHDAYSELCEAGNVTVRISCWLMGDSPDLVSAMEAKSYYPHRIEQGPLKFFLDGAFSSRTAWLVEPYRGEPGNYGTGVPAAEIVRKLESFVLKRRQVASHAIGDRAVREYLKAAEELSTRYPYLPELRIRVEHGQLIQPDDIPRLARLGFHVSAQPHAAASPEKDIDLLGTERARRAYPYRSLLDAGVSLSFGSDFPGEAGFEPLLGIHYAVNREGPEAITPAEALRAYTAGSAYAQFAEADKGTLEPGKLADLVVLSADPTRIDPERIRDIDVELTMMDGTVVYAGDAAPMPAKNHASTSHV
ncbi:MAG: amidohydrolase [Spirochaetaceae bacterium]